MSVARLLGDINARFETRTTATKNSVGILLPDVYRRVSTLQAAKKLVEDQLAPDFCIFDYMKNNENGLSRCLADLFDPCGRHGQRSLFLSTFLKQTGVGDWIEVSGRPLVKTEKTTNKGRRIDIFMEFDNGVIGIENKPWAGDQDRQLSDYADWLETFPGKKHWTLIFLSNRGPDESSIAGDRVNSLTEEKHFFQMSYRDLADRLQDGAGKTKALTVRIFVEELAKYVRTRVNQEIDMTEEHEVKQSVLASSENLAAAFLVANSFENIKRDLLQKLEKDLRAALCEKNYQLRYNKEFFNGRGWNGIGILFDRDQDVCLSFEFDANGYREFAWGIVKTKEEINKPDTTTLKINEIMTTLFGHPGDQDTIYTWWPWYIYANDIEFDKAFRAWQSNPKPWQAMLDGSLADTMVAIAVKVHDAFKDRMDLLLPITTTSVAAGALSHSQGDGASPNLSVQGNVEMTG